MLKLIVPGLWALGSLTTTGLVADARTVKPVPAFAQERQCPTRGVARDAYVRAVDSLETSEGRSPTQGGYPQLEGAALSVRVSRSCVTVLAVNWDGELSGGLVFLDDAGHVLNREASYHGARDLLSAGPNRVAFTYTANKGSGLYESRHVVLCALRSDVWVECLNVIAHKLDIVSGSSSSSQPDSALMMEQWGRLSIRGDTAVIKRRVTYRREGDKKTRELDLGVARLVLP